MVTAVTIVNQSGVTFTFQDSDVHEIGAEVISEIEQNGLSGVAFGSAQLADFEGVRKVISVKGALTTATTTRTSSGTVTSIHHQKNFLEGLQNGLQTPKTFTSPFENVTIMTSRFRTTSTAGQPNELPFSLDIFVGSL